jgi:hypothetical protein
VHVRKVLPNRVEIATYVNLTLNLYSMSKKKAAGGVTAIPVLTGEELLQKVRELGTVVLKRRLVNVATLLKPGKVLNALI